MKPESLTQQLTVESVQHKYAPSDVTLNILSGVIATRLVDDVTAGLDATRLITTLQA